MRWAPRKRRFLSSQDTRIHFARTTCWSSTLRIEITLQASIAYGGSNGGRWD
jgi:hypothetical protein